MNNKNFPGFTYLDFCLVIVAERHFVLSLLAAMRPDSLVVLLVFLPAESVQQFRRLVGLEWFELE